MEKKERSLYQVITSLLRIDILFLFFYQMMEGNFHTLHYFITTFLFTYFDKFLNKWFSFRFSNFINGFLFIFVFLSQIAGRVFDFYTIFSFWDILLHTLAGILFYYIGKELILYFHPSLRKKRILIFFCFCFSLTMGTIWEIFEFTFDQLLYMNMQEARGLVGVSAIKDTMSDLIVLTLGTIFSAILDRHQK